MQTKVHRMLPVRTTDHASQPVTLCIRFVASDDRPQSDLKDALDEELNILFREGLLRNIRLEPIFPCDETPQWKGVFVLCFVGDHNLIAQILRMMVGVRSVSLIPERKVL